MMIVSVFNWDNLCYDYYEVDMKPDFGGWNELQGLGIQRNAQGNGVGIDIEDLLPELPSNARYVGSGDVAKNRIMVIKKRQGMRGYTPQNYSILETVPFTQRPEFYQKKFITNSISPYQINRDIENKANRERLKKLNSLGIHPIGLGNPTQITEMDASQNVGANIPSGNQETSNANTIVPTTSEKNASSNATNSSNTLQPTNTQAPTQSNQNTQQTNQASQNTYGEDVGIPLSVFLVPMLAGATAGYLAASRSLSNKDMGKLGSSILGFFGGILAGITVGREYESYKMTSIAQNKSIETMPSKDTTSRT